MEAAMELFDKHWNQNPVRLLGITGTELVEKQQAYKQLDLFSFKEDAKDEPIFQMMNSVPVMPRSLTGFWFQCLSNSSIAASMMSFF